MSWPYSFPLIAIESVIIQKSYVVLLNLDAANEDANYIEKLAAPNIRVRISIFATMQWKTPSRPSISWAGSWARSARGRDHRVPLLVMAEVTDVLADKKPEAQRVFVGRIGGRSQDCCLSFGAENFGKYVELAGGYNIGSDIITAGEFGSSAPNRSSSPTPSMWWSPAQTGKPMCPAVTGFCSHPGDAQEARMIRPPRSRYRSYDTEDAAIPRHPALFYSGPYEFVAVQQMAKWFHSDLLPDLDPTATFA